MRIAGMIIEYNPLHSGHLYMIEECRNFLGSDTALIGVMSGDFVQRGDFAVVRRLARAKAAAESGVDLVLELPLPWAVASAERFADGGVQMLAATGVVDTLAFGSECGDAAALMELADCLNSADYQEELRRTLTEGKAFAACRQTAVEALLGKERAALLEHPNNILGVEYCKALCRRGIDISPLTVKRKGAGYHEEEMTEELPSATLVRRLLHLGEKTLALEYMAPAMRAAYLEEEAAGRAPVFAETCERAILSKLRSMSREEFAVLDEGQEGLYNRLYEASRTAVSVSEILERAKTKRYAYARLRRMVLWAYLGLDLAECPERVPYLRVLAANDTGRKLLAKMRKCAEVPILTKPADVCRLSEEARKLFALEARAADLYALAYPEISAASGGAIWRERPLIL